jgi:hypothetical protein
VKIAFHDNQLCERGTTVALYDYAHHSERILGHTSVILYRRGDRRNHPAVERRFHERFRCVAYDAVEDIEDLVQREHVDAVYWITFGTRDAPRVSSCPNLVHSVFAHDPHGERYAFVSEWMSRRFDRGIPYVPHMIDLPPCHENLRASLGIPEDAVVLGRYGARDTFDLPFVHRAVERVARAKRDVYFLFANTDRFAAEHPRIIHLDVLSDPPAKATFINTCDAMLHARERGETFGLAVGEFSSLNKPVLTYGRSPERSHLDILGDRAIQFADAGELRGLLHDVRAVIGRHRDWNRYGAFTPDRVMATFRDVFLR